MEEQYERIEKAMNFFNNYIEKHYLLGEMPEFWVFLDWAPLYKDGFSCLFNLMYLSTLKTFTQICSILKKYDKEREYIKRAEDIERRIKKVFWDRKKYVFWDGYDIVKNTQVRKISQHTHTLAILLDINKKYHRLWAEKILLPPMKLQPLTHSDIIEASPFFYYYVIEALKKIGGYEVEIIDFIKRRWGLMLDSGATTCWEMWNPEPGYISLCHAWSAHPIIHFVELIGGIRPAGYNWGEIQQISPVYKINSVKLFIPTPSGNISVERNNGKIDFEVANGIKIVKNKF